MLFEITTCLDICWPGPDQSSITDELCCSSLLTDYPEAQMLIDIWSGDATWRTNKLGVKAAKIHLEYKTGRLWGLTGCNSVISFRDNLNHIKPFTL